MSRRVERLFWCVTGSLFSSRSRLSYTRTLEALKLLEIAVDDAEVVNWDLGEGTETTLEGLMALNMPTLRALASLRGAR